MRKLLTSLIAISMLMPSTVLASSIRPGSPSPKTTYKGSKGPSCLVLVDDGEYVEEKWEKCEVVIDETGVTHPSGKIINVVKWSTSEKDFNVAGGIVGGVAGAGVGFAAGLGSCMFMGPFCLITAPALMNTGGMVGGGVGGKTTGRFFTIVGDDINGRRLVNEIHFKTGKAVRKAQKQLLKTTKLAEGELAS